MVDDIYTIEVPFRGTYRLQRLRFGVGSPHLVIVGGLHGNELNSVYALNLLAASLRAQAPTGTVDLIPMANAFGVEDGRKLGPFDEGDLNRSFPGDPDGTAMQRVAHALFEATCADVCIDLHSGSDLLFEMPQARVSVGGDERELALAMGLPLVWSRRSRAGDATQLVEAWRRAGCRAFRVTGGRCSTLDKDVGSEIAEAIRRLMGALGASRSLPPRAVLAEVDDDRMLELRCESGGFYVPEVGVGERIRAGHLLGRVVAPVGGATLEEVRAPHGGLVTCVRRYPMVHARELLLRIALVGG